MLSASELNNLDPFDLVQEYLLNKCKSEIVSENLNITVTLLSHGFLIHPFHFIDSTENRIFALEIATRTTQNNKRRDKLDIK